MPRSRAARGSTGQPSPEENRQTWAVRSRMWPHSSPVSPPRLATWSSSSPSCMASAYLYISVAAVIRVG